MSSEYMRRKTGLAEYEYGRYGSRGKKLWQFTLMELWFLLLKKV
jgi:hypothetical protein